MALTVSSRVEDGFAILELTGTLTLGPTLSGLRETVRGMFADAKFTGLILHVGGVTVTDSCGMGELTIIYTLATTRHCPLRLVEVGPNLRRMLAMTRLEELLPSCPTIVIAKSEMRPKQANPK